MGKLSKEVAKGGGSWSDEGETWGLASNEEDGDEGRGVGDIEGSLCVVSCVVLETTGACTVVRGADHCLNIVGSLVEPRFLGRYNGVEEEMADGNFSGSRDGDLISRGENDLPVLRKDKSSVDGNEDSLGGGKIVLCRVGRNVTDGGGEEDSDVEQDGIAPDEDRVWD